MSDHFQFDAYAAYHAMKARYADFLLDHFGVRPGPLQTMLLRNWTSPGTDPFRLFAPLIVQGAFPFKPGQTPQSLQAPTVAERSPERPLHPQTVALLKAAGMDYPLYRHQVEAIREAATGRTIILSAGTGSGKTEAFLIPLIDRLFWDQELGLDDISQPGIRAIIVYPLNALVNNQVERLRSLLRHQKSLTFAYFTSRLKDDERVAERALEHRGRKPLPCEMIDRKTLRGLVANRFGRQGPPHILVTNYSMLEYMLIRPLDRSIFLHDHLFHKGVPRLKAVVLDEAHVYAGAQAAEIHMLLRRVARRFGMGLEDVQGFATSATLSQGDAKLGEEDPLETFASMMFAKQHGQVAAIRGERYLPKPAVPLRAVGALQAPESLPPGDLVPAGLYTLAYENGQPTSLVRDAALARLAVDACLALGLAETSEVARLPADAADCPALLLYRIVAGHPKLTALRDWLFQREKDRLPSLLEVAEWLYGPAIDQDAHSRAADAVLRVASLARQTPGDLPFIPVRMHAMVRAPLGVWVDPRKPEIPGSRPSAWPWGEISSMPPEPGDEIPRLELLLCPTCGAAYLEAWEGEKGQIAPRGDEGQQRLLLWPDPEGDKALPEILGGARVRAIRIEREKWDAKAEEPCAKCGDGMKAMRRLRLNPRAALGAIVDSIYPHLGEMPPGSSDAEFMPGRGRRLLSFSDSRQKAAEVATRVENTHDTGLNRQLLWSTLRELDSEVTVTRLIGELRTHDGLKERSAANGHIDDSNALEDLACISVYEEFARPPAKGVTLEILGLVEVVYPNLPRRPTSVHYLTDAEWLDFLAGVLDDARRRGAVIRPDLSSSARVALDEMLPDTIGKQLILSKGADDGLAIDGNDEDLEEGISFLTKKSLRRPFYYAERLLKAVGSPAGVDPEHLLRDVWDALIGVVNTGPCRWLQRGLKGRGNTEALKIDLSLLKLLAHDAPGWIEPASRKVFFRAVRDVCPDAPARQPLRPMTEADIIEWRARHSIRRVMTDPLLGLWSVEHTAQIDVDELEEQEDAFRLGARNLLASSTTMEMGVDLGGLTFVLMTNVPPGPANYWQRAGRAGRRADGSSMVLTLALGRPHDQKVFADPRSLLHEPVTPPRVRLDTPPLLQRHVNAFLLGTFFEEAIQSSMVGNPVKSFGTVEDFLFRGALEVGGLRPELVQRLGLDKRDPLVQGFVRWLAQLEVSSALADGLLRLVKGTELAGSSSTELAQDCGRLLERAVWAARQDREIIQTQQAREEKEGAGSEDKGFLIALGYQLKALESEALIGYLARSGFLPRFGFPVDVVRLETRWTNPPKKDGPRREEADLPDLRMERQLAMALSEYAPGAEVIAGKRVYKVSGVVRNWLSDDVSALDKFYYLQCVHCGHMEERRSDLSLLARCSVCTHPVQEGTEFATNSKEAEKRQRKLKREGREAELEEESGARLPSPVRHYLRPSGFAVKFGKRPKLLGADPVRMPYARVSLMASGADRVDEVLPGMLAVGFAPASRLFVRSEGRSKVPDAPGYGYRICRLCGYTEPESDWDGKLPPTFTRHYKLRSLASCPMKTQYWRHSVLGTSVPVDAFRVRLLGALAPDLEGQALEDFYLTFATLLRQKAAELLQVDSRTLNSTVGTWQALPEQDARVGAFGREAILYEDSGSGMLALVADQALELVQGTVAMLEQKAVAEFVRFDTQFLITRGNLRLDLLRQHFLEPGDRKLYLARRSYLEQEGARLLCGRGPRIAALELMDGASSMVALQALRLADDAFEREGLLRSLRQRALAGLEHGCRLLLVDIPNPNAGQAEEALAAQRLSRLLEDGIAVRKVNPEDKAALIRSPWRLIAARLGLHHALGGMVVDGDGQHGHGTPGSAFGERWIDDAVPVEASHTAAGLAWLDHVPLWERATPVTLAMLEPLPTESTRYLQIREGATDKTATSFEGLFGGCADLGPMERWGEVIELSYSDRYVARNPIGIWMLERLLASLRFAPDAVGRVRYERQREDFLRDLSASDLLKEEEPPSSLTVRESMTMQRWCADRCKARGLLLTFKEEPFVRERRMGHARTLTLRFAPGGRFSSLKVLFERGLDWVYPIPGPEPWTKRPLRARETHVVVVMQYAVAR